jgi:hypothetical protein
MSWASRLSVELSNPHSPTRPAVHVNAPLTQKVGSGFVSTDGWTVAGAAESMHISRQTAHKWRGRLRESGITGLEDRSSRERMAR